jgi:hypothetical protein
MQRVAKCSETANKLFSRTRGVLSWLTFRLSARGAGEALVMERFRPTVWNAKPFWRKRIDQ